MHQTITLTTDFSEDMFAGVMKGVIANINPDARVIDITHGLKLGDIRSGAFVLMASCGYFPRGTIHVVVVDPGVGPSRRIVCAQTKDYIFLAPDNGILSWALTRHEPLEMRAVEKEKFFLDEVSMTFHGRDIFAPVAAHLSLGIKPNELGPEIDPGDVVSIEFPEPWLDDGGELQGEVLYIDRFGNCITNITRDDLGKLDPAKVRISSETLNVEGIHRSYSDVHPGTEVAVIGSTGFLEIAVSGGNASMRFGLRTGDEVTLRQ